MKLIAETAMHHEGDFAFMTRLIEAIGRNTKTDYIKTHMLLDVDEYFVPDHPGYDITKKWLFNQDQWTELLNGITSTGKKPMLLYNDTKAIEFGTRFEPEIVEIHSVAVNDVYLLDCLKANINTDTKIVLGVGGCSVEEIDHAVNHLGHKNMVLMFGFQNYPTKYQDINLRKVRKIMGLYPTFEYGYADHTAWNHEDNILISLFGASLGMGYIEKHVTTNYGEERTDWSAAISIQMFNDLRDKLEILKQCEGNGNLGLNAGERSYSVTGPMKKAAVFNRPVESGQVFELDMISFKRTSQISDIGQIEVSDYLGKNITQDIDKGVCLKKEHFA